MASPLPIHHRWCIADKLLGSNKLSLRGWPRWWKRTPPPHGHRGSHILPFLIQQSELVSVRGNPYRHHYSLGVVCVCVLTQKEQTHNLSPDFGWWVTSAPAGEVKKPESHWCPSSWASTPVVNATPTFPLTAWKVPNIPSAFYVWFQSKYLQPGLYLHFTAQGSVLSVNTH